ncbi:MAG: NTP transferase domain-containing protein [Promethearchaeota archaeon]
MKSFKNYTVVILCAGKGTRMEDLVKNIPKPLLTLKKFNNKTILEILVEELIQIGFETYFIIGGYLKQKLEKQVSKLINKFKSKGIKLKFIDASPDYKLGPVYSFLSIQKIKNDLDEEDILLLFPGDTIFERKLLESLHERINELEENVFDNPILFYQEYETFEREKYDDSNDLTIKSFNVIETSNIENFEIITKFEKKSLKKIQNLRKIKVVIPILILKYGFIHEISKISKLLKENTIIEALDVLNKRKFLKLLAFKIKSSLKYYDLDNKKDLRELEDNSSLKDF